MTSRDEHTHSEVDPLATQASLLGRLHSGTGPDREIAWDEFRRRYSPVIAGFASRCGASRQDIDDIIQDVMTGLLRVGGEFQYDPVKGRFRSFLKTCTVRAAIRRAGKNLRFRGIPLEDVPQAEIAVEPVWNDVWEQQLVAEALEVIRREQCDSLMFSAFEQYVLFDRPAETVAAELRTSVNNVHQAKTRITKLLRERVEQLRQLEQ
jgi:RNA polymerase sigma factor (sigma-70 family)